MFVNALSTAIYWYKDLTVTAVLYGCYFLLSIYGYQAWKKSMEGYDPAHHNHSGS
jgi:TRAP-type C4-dicarboxylate transport system permease small subunit